MGTQTDDDTVDLAQLGEEVLQAARDSSAGRSARALLRGPGAGLTQTMLALTAGQRLDEHESPGVATLHVLQGRIDLLAGGQTYPLSAGQWRPIPAMRHSVESHDDAVVLLSVSAGKPPREVTD